MSQYTSILPPLSPEEYSALKDDIRQRGAVLVPIEVDEFGTVLDGGHRLRAVEELRAEGHLVAEPLRAVRSGLTDPQKRSLARSLNLWRRHLTQEQRRNLIADELRERPEKSNNSIAQGLGVSDMTVAKVRRELEETSQIGKLDRTVGADGKERPASRPAPVTPVVPDMPTPPIRSAAPIFVESPRQLEKVRALAEAGRMDLAAQKGVGAAHKQMREEQRKADLREAHPQGRLQVGGVIIQQGDVLDVLAGIETESVQCVFTDWPYNIGRHGGGTKVGADFASFSPGEWDDREQSEWMDWCGAVLARFKRVLSPTGCLVLFTDRALISYLWDNLKSLKMSPKNTITWHKTNAAPNARGNLDSATEMAIWAVRGPGYTFHRPLTGQCPNIWAGPFVSGPTRIDYPHPTAKPVALIQHYLEIFTDPGDLVLDPFGGSGSTLEACERLGRRCLTSDSDPNYVAMMAQRLDDVRADMARGAAS